MLSFICGTSESQKLKEIYRRATLDSNQGKSVFILVPEQYSMYAESQMLSTLGLKAQNKIQILTFSRLCNLIFSNLGPLRTEYMDKAGKYIMTRRALTQARGDLRFFTRNLNQHGFSSLIRSIISEFKRYGITPDNLREIADKTTDPRLALKLGDLETIFRNFNQLVEKSHMDSEDNLSLIIPKVSCAHFLEGSFYINFFKSFTPTEYSVICELMKRMDITIALSTNSLDGNSEIFASQQNTYNKLSGTAKALGIKTADPFFVSEEDCIAPDLKHLKENFFAPYPKAYPGDPENIHIYRPDNYYSEVSGCARLIRKLLREDGYSYNDILILTGNIENYELILPQIFEEYEISYFLDKKTPLIECPLLRMIISVLEILVYGFSYDRIMVMIRSGFFPISRNGADILENYILAADIGHSQWNSRTDWEYNPDPNAFDMEQINSLKEVVIHPLLDLCQMFSGRKTTKEICENFYKWLNGLGLPEIVNDKINKLKTSGLNKDAKQLRLMWNNFVSVTNQICDYMGDEQVTFKDFLEIFVSACGELSVGMIPPTRDKVVVSSVDTFRSTGSRAVIVLGALDGVFPRDYTTEGLLSDSERLMLQESGLILAPDTYTQQRDEQFLVYSVLTTATEQLHIYSPLGDRDGKGLRPSEILDTIKSAVFPEIVFKHDTSTDDTSFADSREVAFRHLSTRLFANEWNISLLPPAQKVTCDILENDRRYSTQMARLRKMHQSKNYSQKLSPQMAQKLYGAPLTLSVSKLEKYNACAFAFFLQYGLIAQERALGGLKASDTGTILHNVLCDYFKEKSQNSADYGQISREQCFAEISQLVDKEGQNSNQNLFAASHYYKYMMLRLKNIATSTAWKLIRFYSQSQFRPTGFEISFGKKGVYPPYVLDTKNGDVSLKGFIDRVDSAEIQGVPYITITDYKSSERHLDMDLANAGIHLQPLIYANALKQHIPGTQVAGMFYLQMNDPILKFGDTPTDEAWEKGMNDNIKAHGKILDDPDVILSIDKSHSEKSAIHYFKCDKNTLMEKQELDNALEGAHLKATETADNILEGKIETNPAFVAGFDPCQYCPYGAVCQKKN